MHTPSPAAPAVDAPREVGAVRMEAAPLRPSVALPPLRVSLPTATTPRSLARHRTKYDMAAQAAPSPHPSTKRTNVMNEVLGGSVAALINTLRTLSFAGYVFSGDLAPLFAPGVAWMLIGTYVRRPPSPGPRRRATSSRTHAPDNRGLAAPPSPPRARAGSWRR